MTAVAVAPETTANTTIPMQRTTSPDFRPKPKPPTVQLSADTRNCKKICKDLDGATPAQIETAWQEHDSLEDLRKQIAAPESTINKKEIRAYVSSQERPSTHRPVNGNFSIRTILRHARHARDVMVEKITDAFAKDDALVS